jgi:exopolysaccharide production protein ExoQ
METRIGYLGRLVADGDSPILTTAFIVIVTIIYTIQTGSVIILAAGIFLVFSYAVLLNRQLIFFIINNKAIMAYPIIVLISALWSSIPLISLSGGVQLCATIGAGILMGISATQRQLVRGIFFAMAIFVTLSIISGRSGPSAAGPVLVGLTGSKDMMGYAGMTLFASGTAVIVDRGQRSVYRLCALIFTPLGAYIATNVHSAAPMLSSIAYLPTFIGILGLRYFNMKERWLLVVLAILLAIFAAVATYSLLPDRAFERILLALNKDATLTGRTVIWQKAEQWIAASPEIGHGFRSFWLGGSSDVTGILHRFRVGDPRAFEIHQTFMEVLVDTGWVGLIAFLMTVLSFLYFVVTDAFLAPNAGSAFVATMYLLILVRTPVETIIGANAISTVLFYVCGTASIVSYRNRALGYIQCQRAPTSRRLMGSSLFET